MTITMVSRFRYQSVYSNGPIAQRARGRWWREFHSAIGAESCGEKSRKFSLTRFGQHPPAYEGSGIPSRMPSKHLLKA